MGSGSVNSRVLSRERGSLTGSSSAGLVNRIVIEDAALLALPNFCDSFAVNSEIELPLLAWSDNLATIGTNFESAVEHMQIWHFYLSSVMGMRLKPSSFEAIQSATRNRGPRERLVNGEVWFVKDSLKCLGTWIASTGECNSQANALMSLWSRAFWANSKLLTNRRASITSRLRFWGRIAFGLADHIWATLKPSVALASRLDSSLNKLIKFIVGVRPLLGESPAEFCKRRNRVVASEKTRAKFDMRLKWAKKLTTWVEHLHRHPENVSLSLTQTQDDSWLRERRREAGGFGASRSEHRGATNTRAGCGVPIRWGERWLEDIGSLGSTGPWENPSKSIPITMLRANALRSRYLTRMSPTLAIADLSA